MSVEVRTRKMVNYAWVERSLGKLRWRLVAILTCKSFVILGYKGERLLGPHVAIFTSLIISKSEETLMEAHGDTDVPIVRRTWV